MASAMEGWTRKEKLYILQGLNSLDFDKMETKIPQRTRQEIKNAVLYVVNGLADGPRKKRVTLSQLQYLASITSRDPNQHRLRTQIIRMLPNFNYVPPTESVLNIDFREVFQQIANAIEGRPVVADAATMDILELIIEEVSELCEGYVTPELRAFIARINSSTIPMPPSAAKKEHLRSVARGMHAPAQTKILPKYPRASTNIPPRYPPATTDIPQRYPPANTEIPQKHPPANTVVVPRYPPANTDIPQRYPPANTDITPRYPSANTGIPQKYPPVNTDVAPMYPPPNTEIPSNPPMYPTTNSEIPPMYPAAKTEIPPMYLPANTDIPPTYPPVNTNFPAVYSPANINVPVIYSPANNIIPAIYSPANLDNPEIYEPVNINIPAMYETAKSNKSTVYPHNSEPATYEFEPIHAPVLCQYGPIITPATCQYEPVLALANYNYELTHAPPNIIYNPAVYPPTMGNYNQLHAPPLYNIICTPTKVNCGIAPCNIYDPISVNTQAHFDPSTVPAHPPRREFPSGHAGTGAYHSRRNKRDGNARNKNH